MKLIKKRIILILMTFILAFVGLVLLVAGTKVKAADFADEYFATENVVLTTNQTLPKATGILDYRRGILATTSKNNSKLNFRETISGKFTIDMMPFSSMTYSGAEYESSNYSNSYQDLNTLSLVFKDVDNNKTFKVVINGGAIGNSVTANAHVEYDGQKMGINYFHDENASSNTAGANARGIYTFLWGTSFSNMAVNSGKYSSGNVKSLQIEFDPQTMCVYGYSYGYSSYQGKKVLIWDLSKAVNDGYEVGKTLDGFENYQVSLVFESLAKDRTANVLIYSINGQDFENSRINNAAGPNVQVNLVNGKVGQKYVLPTPVAYDVIEGKIPFDGEVQVYDEKGSKVNLFNASDQALTGKFVEGAYFTPETAGVYRILYTAKDSTGLAGETLETKINILSGNEVVLTHGLSDSFFLLDSSVNVPSGSFTYQNQQYATTLKVYDPENNQADISSGQVRFSKVGRFIFRFSSNLPSGSYSEDVYAFVASSAESLFEVKANASLAFGRAALSTNLSGIVVTSSLNNATIRYKNPIDFSNKTKNDLLVELLALPQVWGASDFSQIQIKLVDADNSLNYVLIVCSASESDFDTTYIRTGSAEQKLAGRAKDGSISTSSGSGTPTLHSFSGQSRYRSLENQTIQIYFDYASRRIYTADNKLVADLDDTQYFSNSWTGFKNNRAYLEISVSSLTRENPKYLVKNINGLNLESSIALDKTAPELVYDESLFVDGLVGSSYPLPEVLALDKIEGELPVSVKVSFEGSAVTVSNGSFTPTNTGKYQIIYSAIDSFGNQVVLQKNIDIVQEIEPVNLEITGNATPGYVGTAIAVPEYIAFGGSGKLTITIVAKGQNTNTEYTVSDLSFLPLVADTYTITYTATDRLGNNQIASQNVTVTVSEKPIIQVPDFIPKFLISGVESSFSLTTAIDYNSTPAAAVTVTMKLIIEGKTINLTNNAYTPAMTTMNSIAILQYSATSTVTGKTEVLEFEIPAVKLYDNYERLHIEQYFLTDGISNIDPKTNYIDFTAERSGASLTFIKEVASDGFQIAFTTPGTANNTDKFTILMIDSNNPAKTVKLEVRKANSTDLFSYLTINGLETTAMAGTFYGTTSSRLKVYYDNSLFSISDDSGLPIAYIKSFEDGSPFTGFSTTIDFKIIFGEVTGVSTLRLYQIGNQLISSIDDDYTVPSISLLGEMARTAKLNDRVTIPNAFSYDVLSFESSASIRVTDPNNTVIYTSSNGTGTQIQITKYGTYYVTYQATDGNGNSMSLTRAISVLDDIAPEITLDGKMPTSAKLGSKLTLPTFTASDNLSTNISKRIFVINPDNVMSVVENNSVTVSMVGEYTIRYFAIDEAGNLKFIDYVIEVK